MSATDSGAEGRHHRGMPVLAAGPPLAEAAAAGILLHGRGASAEDILALSEAIGYSEVAWLAPQARHNTWYPDRFTAPFERNEPWLSSALEVVGELVAGIVSEGVSADRLVLGGFSQGACLASEFAVRNARRYGGLLAFSGGLIGPPGTPRDYEGSLEGTPVFIGCSDMDAHIPLERVLETSATLRALDAEVFERIYPGMGHTIVPDEIKQARLIVTAAVEGA